MSISRRISTRPEALAAHVRLVAIDFTRDALDATLAAPGYEPQQRTFFIREGVMQYLDEASARKKLAFLATAAHGSRLVFTYVRRDFLAGRHVDGQDALYRRFVAKRGIWRFGIDPADLSAFLAPYGWRVIEAPEPETLARRYIDPTDRALGCMPIGRSVCAERV